MIACAACSGSASEPPRGRGEAPPDPFAKPSHDQLAPLGMIDLIAVAGDPKRRVSAEIEVVLPEGQRDVLPVAAEGRTLGLSLTIGRYTFRAFNEGGASETKSVEIAAGANGVLELQISKTTVTSSASN